MNRWTLWITLITVWTIALEIPVPTTSHLPGGQVIATNRYLVAKALHVIVYAGMTLSAGWLRIPVRYRWLMMFFLMVHAALSELLQLALESWCHRGGSLADVGYDQLGIAIGAALGWKWWMQEDAK